MKQVGVERMYKILTHDAKSAHGGDFDWNPYLPKYKWNNEFTDGKWMPGEWLKCNEPLSWCQTGFHLTSHPLRWIIKKGRIFIAEYRGNWIQEGTTDKACFSEVRLVAELGIDTLDLDVKLFKILTSGANLSDANLSYANLSGANLLDADLSYANLPGAKLSYANLSGADLSGANLTGANLSDANLTRANLSGANLSRANLSGAKLSRANLSRANLSGANLSDADLTYANLSGAKLSYANLSGADLSGAFIHQDPVITGWKFNNGRLWRA
jgi:hypothetical protein